MAGEGRPTKKDTDEEEWKTFMYYNCFQNGTSGYTNQKEQQSQENVMTKYSVSDLKIPLDALTCMPQTKRGIPFGLYIKIGHTVGAETLYTVAPS